MLLNVVPSPCCSLHQIKMSKLLRKNLGLDLGDWLIFDCPAGNFSVKVSRISHEELLEFGDFISVVNDQSPILGAKVNDVYVDTHKLTIGCDPELFLVNKYNGKLVIAHTLLPKNSQFGNDGDLAELRPDYGEGPEQLLVNIKDLIKTIPSKIPDWVDIYTGSWFANRCSFLGG